MFMNFIRVVFLGLAVLLPVTWTVAKAADEAPAEGSKETKKAKKSSKKKKSEGTEEKKPE
jgi:hypothetical protein